MNEPEKYLKELGLTESEITVYLKMVAGATSARDLIKTTKMKRPTVYYALNSLEKRGLVSKSGKEGDATFIIAPYERLVSLAKSREDEAYRLTEKISELVPIFNASSVTNSEKPEVSFFEGIRAVKNVIMDIMYTQDKHIDLIVPAETFFWSFGEEFMGNYISERRSRNIKTRDLWEVETDSKKFQKYYSTLSHVRILPDTMKHKFKTTIFLFDDKTLYVSSSVNSYAVLIKSKEHRDTISAMFDGLWEISRPHSK